MNSPTEVTNFNRTIDQLELFWIFCIIVAGKPSDWALRTTTKFLQNRKHLTPFEHIQLMGHGLRNTLVANKVGQYTRIEGAIRASLKLDLETVTLDELMALPGVGPKTARFFLLHSRRDSRVAVLDTHVLKWLRNAVPEVPEQTPSNQKDYERLEGLFLSFAKMYFGDMPIAEVDLLIWSVMSGRLDFDLPLPRLPEEKDDKETDEDDTDT